ncbi:hypothetical protein NDU88_002311 [Pleurodeles waltl]|uniref:Uncharacterized protein n=1 Tax=Pleurodeles waltl TaxID=8319 RepID=A0AAV7VA78_PLEWA|nr:hypothetical protein NDU88_002311 [Pleurodeles waltl]
MLRRATGPTVPGLRPALPGFFDLGQGLLLQPLRPAAGAFRSLRCLLPYGRAELGEKGVSPASAERRLRRAQSVMSAAAPQPSRCQEAETKVSELRGGAARPQAPNKLEARRLDVTG